MISSWPAFACGLFLGCTSLLIYQGATESDAAPRETERDLRVQSSSATHDEALRQMPQKPGPIKAIPDEKPTAIAVASASQPDVCAHPNNVDGWYAENDSDELAFVPEDVVDAFPNPEDLFDDEIAERELDDELAIEDERLLTELEYPVELAATAMELTADQVENQRLILERAISKESANRERIRAQAADIDHETYPDHMPPVN